MNVVLHVVVDHMPMYMVMDMIGNHNLKHNNQFCWSCWLRNNKKNYLKLNKNWNLKKILNWRKNKYYYFKNNKKKNNI